jgi:hypothetical protein
MFKFENILSVLAQCNYRSESTTSNRLWSSDSVTNENNPTNVDSGSHTMTKIPKRSDMVIWYSTLKGNCLEFMMIFVMEGEFLDYVSWRLADEGSIFIQSLITVFARTAWCYDLVTMVQCVSKLIDWILVYRILIIG